MSVLRGEGVWVESIFKPDGVNRGVGSSLVEPEPGGGFGFESGLLLGDAKNTLIEFRILFSIFISWA